MSGLLEFADGFWTVLGTVLGWVLKGLIIVFITAFKIIFPVLLEIVKTVLQALDLGPYAVNSAAAWGALDPNAAYMINALGFPQGLTLLGGAYLIRIILNLIPAAITRV